MDGATIEPLAPLLLLLNDFEHGQITDNEQNDNIFQLFDSDRKPTDPIKKVKKRGPKI